MVTNLIAQGDELNEKDRKSLRYSQQRNPIRRLFPSSYVDGYDSQHFRLYPMNDLGKKSGIVGLKGSYKYRILSKLNNDWLPEGYRLVNVDLTACHTGIFVGLAGARMAPFTTEAYISQRFWERILDEASKSGLDVKKAYLKRIFYKALNGGSVETPESIASSLRTYYPDELDQETALKIAVDMKKLPVIKELGAFQHTLANRQYVYLSFATEPFRGGYAPEFRSTDKKTWPSRSSYHGGLMSSRVLVSAEQVIIVSLCKKLLERGCIPMCLEHDGLLVLTNDHDALRACREDVMQISKRLLGVEIDLESKDHIYDLSTN
jgi:hypothetical protein